MPKNSVLSALAATRAKTAPKAGPSGDASKADKASLVVGPCTMEVPEGHFGATFPIRDPELSSTGKCHLLSKAVLGRGAVAEGIPVASTFIVRTVG